MYRGNDSHFTLYILTPCLNNTDMLARRSSGVKAVSFLSNICILLAINSLTFYEVISSQNFENLL